MLSSTRSVVKVFVIGLVGATAVVVLLPPAAKDRQRAVIERIPDPPTLACNQQLWAGAERGCLGWTAPRRVAAIDADQAQYAGTSERISAAHAAVAAVAAAPAVADPAAPANAAPAADAAPAATPVAAAEPAPATGAEPQQGPAAASADAGRTEPAARPALRVAARPAAATAAAAHGHKSRAAQRSAREAFGMMRSFGDTLSDVPATGYASDPARRRTIRPTSIQDVYYYQHRGMLPPTAAPSSRR